MEEFRMPLVILKAFRWYHYFIFEKNTLKLVSTAYKTACVLIERRHGGHFTVSLW